MDYVNAAPAPSVNTNFIFEPVFHLRRVLTTSATEGEKRYISSNLFNRANADILHSFMAAISFQVLYQNSIKTGRKTYFRPPDENYRAFN